MAKERRRYVAAMKRQAKKEAEEVQWPGRVEIPNELAMEAESARLFLAELLPTHPSLIIVEKRAEGRGQTEFQVLGV